MAQKSTGHIKHQGTFGPGRGAGRGGGNSDPAGGLQQLYGRTLARFAADCRAQGLRMGAYIF